MKKLVPWSVFLFIMKTFGGQVYERYDIELFQNKTSESMGYNKYVYPKQQSNY